MSRTIKYIFLAVFQLLIFFEAKTQTDLLFSLHGMNQKVFNPATMDDNGRINLEMMARQQWIGFPDAPAVQYLSVDMFMDEQPMGLKLSFLNQTAGKEITRQLNLAYAYQVRISNEIELRFGLSAGFYQRQLLYSDLIFEEGNEPLIKPDESVIKPDFSFGAELYWNNFTLGMAANHITTPNRKATIFRIPIHNHLYLNHQISLNPQSKFLTEISWHQQGTINRMQLGALIETGILEAGLAYRHQDAIIIRAGIAISEKIKLHYSYDLGISKIANYNSGTHEIGLQFGFPKKSGTYLSPRFLD
jgi:type IX secretion system PorP/SprF family membrane protein